MLKSDNLTKRENALKVFVRDNASLHPRTRSLRAPLRQEKNADLSKP
jgi:hypothetical protein